MNRLILFLTLIFAPAGLLLAQDASGIKAANIKGADLDLMQNHDPAVEEANFELLPGFEVNLFASEPMLANPIHMVWDARGRLWVACSWAYPQLKPGEKANDKIIILEDTDADGRADKSTVFAEGLYMPTGIELANGGCYVAQTPDVFFLKDTDGNDVADVKELALTGFGIEDSHHSISAWRRGPGGWLYFQEGIFLHSQVETQHGVVRNYNGGVYQYNPRTHELRMFARIGVGNPWGHVFDRWGQSFFIDNPRVSYLSPSTGNSGEKVELAKLIQTEKQCGGDLASGTHLPEEIRGQLLTCRFKSRTVVRYEFLEEGAGFTARVLEPLIASKHPNFRPVDCKVGPDGAVYVADWYNSIINHAQHDFRDPRRDHHHGRIWRITASDRPLVKRPKLVRASVENLLENLKSPEAWTRHQARSVLSERDREEVAAGLEEWIETLSADDPDHDHHLVEAMWACQNIERPSEAILQRVMAAKGGHARSAGARVIRYWHGKLSDPVAMIAKAAEDPFPRVRMEAVLSAGFVPKAEAFPAALRVLDHERDKLIDLALSQTTTALAPYWGPAMEAGTLKFAQAAHREYAEREGGIDFDKLLAAFLKRDEHSERELQIIKRRLVDEGNAKHVKLVVARMKPGPARLPRKSIAALGEALCELGRRGTAKGGAKHVLPLKWEALFPIQRDEMWIDLMAAWKLQEVSDEMWEGTDAAYFDYWANSFSRGWARAAGEIGGARNLKNLENLTKEGRTLDARYLGVLGLAGADLEAAAAAAAEVFALERAPEYEGDRDGKVVDESIDHAPDPIVVLQEFTSRSKGTALLAAALKGKPIHDTVKERVTKVHRETGQIPASLLKDFDTTPHSLGSALLKETRRELVADVVSKGDPGRGEFIYRRKALACTSCHGIGPVGPEIGPNLAAVGAAATPDYIVEAILEPNKSIAEHFDNAMITLANGELRMGVITFKSEKEIVLRDSTQAGKEIRIPQSQIKQTSAIPSLMPAGLVDQLQDRQEFLDLANFVSQLGRPGSYANDESAVVRKWTVRWPNRWQSSQTIYSTVSGELPMRDLPLAKPESEGLARVYFTITVLEGGEVKLKLNDRNNVALAYLSLDERGAKYEEIEAPLALKKGRYQFQAVIEKKARGNKGLRIEFVPAPGSSAKVQLEGGD